MKPSGRQETFEKCGEKKPREEPVKPARRRKTFEKCGEGIPREVQAKPARSAGIASDKSRRSRRKGLGKLQRFS